ncbi:MAG: hypothetical protein U9R34_04025 [Nanoarchaeota archaeon]|nr:hypothetical protein [Nanoarchaeota archaeon]
MDLKLAEWNAGLSRGIIKKQVTNIKETMDYIARNNALYKRWHNQKRGTI